METNGACRRQLVSQIARPACRFPASSASPPPSVTLLEATECEVTNRPLSRQRQSRCLSAFLSPPDARDAADKNGQENAQASSNKPV